MLALAVLALLDSGLLASFGALSIGGERLARLAGSPEWRGGHFENAQPTGVMKGEKAWAVLREQIFGEEERVPRGTLPLFAQAPGVLAQTPQSGLRVTWLGHSSVLLELDGARVLTDPQWSLRASPFAHLGPRRMHPPPLPLSQLGHLDAVLISHDHYDHLDRRTVQALARTGVRFLVPLGVGAHLEKWGVPEGQVLELDWSQEVQLPFGVRALAVPARHFSGRLLAKNPTLWTSWVLAGPRHRIFFSGDTGPHQRFSEIATRHGPFDLALLEIGQYHPSWGDIHLGPAGALEACAALGVQRLLPIHWGTFVLALHGWSEPAEQVYAEGTRRGLQVLTPLLGEPVEPALWKPREPWWRKVP